MYLQLLFTTLESIGIINSSNGYSFAIGRFVISPPAVRSSTARTSPSFPVMSPWITPNFQRTRGLSSWICTTSPTFTVWLLRPWARWNSRKPVRYSDIHLCLKWSRIVIFRANNLFASPALILAAARSSPAFDSSDVTASLLPQSKCDGVSGSGSRMSLDTYVNGRSFITSSISRITVFKVSSFTSALPNTFSRWFSLVR